MRFRLAIIGVAVLATGCVYPRYQEGEWPTGVPPQSYYLEIYDSSANNHEHQPLGDYLTWVIRFYEGYGLISGWHLVSQKLLRELPEERHMFVAAKIAYLGQLISGEWAKSNEVRRINAKTLGFWARLMRQAKKQGRLEETVDRLLSDTLELLTDKIKLADITKERYADLYAGEEEEERSAAGNGEE